MVEIGRVSRRRDRRVRLSLIEKIISVSVSVTECLNVCALLCLAKHARTNTNAPHTAADITSVYSWAALLQATVSDILHYVPQ